MYKNYKKILGLVSLWLPIAATATPMNDYSFKSPSFNGQGYSSHVLTIENQEYTRQQQIIKDALAAVQAQATAQQNTNIAKFLNNLESRIYAQISQNLATAMFANGGSNSGTMNFEGNTIAWYKDIGGNIVMNVTDTTGNVTSVTIPLSQFQFPSSGGN